MSLIMHLSGWLPDRDMPGELKEGEVKNFENHVDRPAFAAAAASQSGTDYDIPSAPPIYNQLNIGSCVLNATCAALNMLLAVQGLPTAMLARLFLYFLCRDKQGDIDNDTGTWPQLAVERAGKIGVCEESFWSYSFDNFLTPDQTGQLKAVRPSPECYPEASDNRPTGWFNISATGQDRLGQMEASVRSNHPIIFGTPVGQALRDYVRNQVLSIPASNTIIGGHSMVVSGVRFIGGKRYWRVRNSWSEGWGDGGYCLIDDNYAAWPEFSDLWVLSRIDPLMF